MVEYGLTRKNEKLICEKAKTKKDGCYRFRGVAYRVKDGKVTHFGNQGKILLNKGWGHVVVGYYKVDLGSVEKAQNFLKGITE